MKKITVLIATILFSIGSSLAQGDPTFGESSGSSSNGFITKGTKYFGGMLGFNISTEKHEDASSSSDGPKTTDIDIIPGAGIAISDKFSVGLDIGYWSSSTKTIETDFNGNDVDLTDKIGQFVVGPKFGYYKQVTDRLYCAPYAYLGFGFGNSSQEFLSGDEVIKSEDKISSFEIGATFGLKYFVANKWALTFNWGNVYYNNTTQTDKEDSNHKWKNSDFGIDVDLTSVGVGVYYFPDF